MGYIYKITNSINDKVYIGQTRQPLNTRWQTHKWNAKNGKDYYLYRAMRKYGIDNFSIELVEECSNELLNEKEIYYIQKFNCFAPQGYNSTLGGDGVTRYDYAKIVQDFKKCDECINKTSEKYGYSYDTIKNALNAYNIKAHENSYFLQTPIYECDVDNNILKRFSNYQEVVDFYPELRMTTTGIGNFLATPRLSRYRGKYFCRVSDYNSYKTQNHHNKSYVPIICLEEDIEFESISAAARWLKDNKPEYKGSVSTMISNISKAISNNWKSYGYTWIKFEN